MGKGQVVAPKPSSSSKKDKTKPKMIEKSTIKKASKSKNQFIEKKIEQVFKMKDSEVTEIKAKTSKIEKKEEQNEQIEHEKVKVLRKESVLKSKSKSDEISLKDDNPLDDTHKSKRHDDVFWGEHGVIRVKGIPHGFYEEQMRKFFSQFGKVTNLKLNRSKKTGGSRGFAFVQFRYKEVAVIVAEAMNNYLMFDCILKVIVYPQEKCGPSLFWNKIDPEQPPMMKRREKMLVRQNHEKSEEFIEKRRDRQAEKLKKMEEKLAACGADFKIELS